jgi:hypothetical protein
MQYDDIGRAENSGNYVSARDFCPVDAKVDAKLDRVDPDQGQSWFGRAMSCAHQPTQVRLAKSLENRFGHNSSSPS